MFKYAIYQDSKRFVCENKQENRLEDEAEQGRRGRNIISRLISAKHTHFTLGEATKSAASKESSTGEKITTFLPKGHCLVAPGDRTNE